MCAFVNSVAFWIDREEREKKVAERTAILKEQGVPYIFVVWSEGLPILDVMLKTKVEPFFGAIPSLSCVSSHGLLLSVCNGPRLFIHDCRSGQREAETQVEL